MGKLTRTVISTITSDIELYHAGGTGGNVYMTPLSVLCTQWRVERRLEAVLR